MLTHSVIGPDSRGVFLVVYPTPGCSVPTVIADASDRAAAQREADRLNQLQTDAQAAEAMAKRLRIFCGSL